MSNAGRVTGIEDISQGIGLDLKPYLARRRRQRARARARPATTGDIDVGARRVLQRHAGAQGQLHGQHRLRRDRGRPAAHQPHALPAVLPREARVLPRRRQLLRLPARRRRARSSAAASASTQGEPQPIVYGAKLIGQVGQQDVGFLQVQHRANEMLPIDGVPTELQGRGLHRGPRQAALRQRSRALGVIYTRRARARVDRRDPRTPSAADVTLATPSFLGDSALRLGDLWFVHTTKPEFTHRGRRPRRPQGGTDAYGWRVSVDRGPVAGRASISASSRAPTTRRWASRRAATIRRWNPQRELERRASAATPTSAASSSRPAATSTSTWRTSSRTATSA